MEPIQALTELYNATRQFPLTADQHDRLKACATNIGQALSDLQKSIASPKELKEQKWSPEN